jgi:hypothetical protein
MDEGTAREGPAVKAFLSPNSGRAAALAAGARGGASRRPVNAFLGVSVSGLSSPVRMEPWQEEQQVMSRAQSAVTEAEPVGAATGSPSQFFSPALRGKGADKGTRLGEFNAQFQAELGLAPLKPMGVGANLPAPASSSSSAPPMSAAEALVSLEFPAPDGRETARNGLPPIITDSAAGASARALNFEPSLRLLSPKAEGEGGRLRVVAPRDDSVGNGIEPPIGNYQSSGTVTGTSAGGTSTSDREDRRTPEQGWAFSSPVEGSRTEVGNAGGSGGSSTVGPTDIKARASASSAPAGKVAGTRARRG